MLQSWLQSSFHQAQRALHCKECQPQAMVLPADAKVPAEPWHDLQSGL